MTFFIRCDCELTSHLCSLSFTQSNHDRCLFVRSQGSSFLALLIYVDDILLTGSSSSTLQSVKDSLHSRFTIKDMGFAKYFLDLEVTHSVSIMP